MHISESKFRQFIDGELPESEHKRIASHFIDCITCTNNYQNELSRAEWIVTQLSMLSPENHEQPHPVSVARARLEAKIKSKENNHMLSKIFSKKLHPALTVISLIVILAIAVAIPSVRAAAVNFLGLFRIQQIEVVEFNPANLPTDLDQRMMDVEDILADKLTVVEQGEPVEISDALEASDLAGFPVVFPDDLSGSKRITYQPAVEVAFEVDLALWQGLLNDVGHEDIKLPKALDGQTITFYLPNSVTYTVSECDLESENDANRPSRRCNFTTLIQMPSPSIDAPPGLPIDSVGEAFLQIFGMSPEEAASFSERVDWSTTLVIPVPQNSNYRDVSVNGVPGTLFEQPHGGSNSNFTLMWIEDGIFYGLSGRGQSSEALRIADALK